MVYNLMKSTHRNKIIIIIIIIIIIKLLSEGYITVVDRRLCYS